MFTTNSGKKSACKKEYETFSVSRLKELGINEELSPTSAQPDVHRWPVALLLITSQAVARY